MKENIETLYIPKQYKPDINSSVIYPIGIKEYCIINKDEDIFVIDNICPHQGASLGLGEIKGKEIICPLHEFRFNIKSGKCNIERYTISTYKAVFTEE